MDGKMVRDKSRSKRACTLLAGGHLKELGIYFCWDPSANIIHSMVLSRADVLDCYLIVCMCICVYIIFKSKFSTYSDNGHMKI